MQSKAFDVIPEPLVFRPGQIHVYPNPLFGSVCVEIEAASSDNEKVRRTYVLPLDEKTAASMAEFLTRAVEEMKAANKAAANN